MNRLKRQAATVAVVIVTLAAIAALLQIERSRTELRWRAGFLTGNPRRGGELFHDRGCAHCHAVAGIGSKVAKDLARPRRQPVDLYDVTAALWNHAPEMWKEMESQGHPPPALAPDDVADLLGFLFMAGYLEEEGNPTRGEAVLAAKKCRSCHATGEQEQKIGPDLTRWASIVNPILWAQLLWNHAPGMEKALRDQGLPWPHLEREELVDLMAFLRTIGAPTRRIAPLPGDPVSGRSLFRAHCLSCHRAEGEGGTVGPDLGAASASRTLSGLAASLWNHTPAMIARMKEQGVERPSFTEQEMADLVTYLFAVRYFDPPGNLLAGKEAYERSCRDCHGQTAEGGVGPSLRPIGVRASATFLASALWNHGPGMHEEMTRRGQSWPSIQGHEMRDLIEYLRSLSP